MEVEKKGPGGGGFRVLKSIFPKRKAHEHRGRASFTASSEELEMSAREAAETRLAVTAGKIQNFFIEPVVSRDEPRQGDVSILDQDRILDENDPRSKMFIEQSLAVDVYRPNFDATSDAWSAATTSAHVRGFLGAETNQEAKQMGFRPYAAHRLYMNDSFKTKDLKKGESYEYDMYMATRLGGKMTEELKPGDLLFRGYDSENDDRDFKNTKNWKFGQFKRSGEKGESYNSHTDIIVGTGVDEQGRKYYDVAGGNVEGKYMLTVMYADELRDTYKGAMISKY